MNTLHGFTLPILLAAPLIASGSISSDSLEWNPAPEKILRMELITKHFLVTESMLFRTDGKETVSQRIFELQTTQTLRTSDQFLEVGDGRPSKFRRYYDEVRLTVLSETSGGTKQTRDRRLEARGGVDGLSVVFTWVPEDKEYGRYFDSREGVEEGLPGLAEDLGMRSLLPSEPVTVGDSWELPPGFMADVVGPGGNLNFDTSEAKDPNTARTIRLGTGGYLSDVFGGEEKGTVTATWTEVEEVDGHRLAKIELKFDVTVSKDLADLANRARTVREISQRHRVEAAKVTLQLVGKGVIRWDLEGNHLFDTQELRADEKVSTHLIFDGGDDGPGHEQELLMIGKLVQETKVTTD
jgi:hypothetical protein